MRIKSILAKYTNCKPWRIFNITQDLPGIILGAVAVTATFGIGLIWLQYTLWYQPFLIPNQAGLAIAYGVYFIGKIFLEICIFSIIVGLLVRNIYIVFWIFKNL